MGDSFPQKVCKQQAVYMGFTELYNHSTVYAQKWNTILKKRAFASNLGSIKKKKKQENIYHLHEINAMFYNIRWRRKQLGSNILLYH